MKTDTALSFLLPPTIYTPGASLPLPPNAAARNIIIHITLYNIYVLRYLYIRIIFFGDAGVHRSRIVYCAGGIRKEAHKKKVKKKSCCLLVPVYSSAHLYTYYYIYTHCLYPVHHTHTHIGLHKWNLFRHWNIFIVQTLTNGKYRSQIELDCARGNGNISRVWKYICMYIILQRRVIATVIN